MKIRSIEWSNGNGKHEVHDGVLSSSRFSFFFLIVSGYFNKEDLTLYCNIQADDSIQSDSEVIGRDYKTVEEAKLAAAQFVEDFIKGLLEPDSDQE